MGNLLLAHIVVLVKIKVLDFEQFFGALCYFDDPDGLVMIFTCLCERYNLASARDGNGSGKTYFLPDDAVCAKKLALRAYVS